MTRVEDLPKHTQGINSLFSDTENQPQSYKKPGSIYTHMFELISDFAKEHMLIISFEFDCLGELIIRMTREDNIIRDHVQRFEMHYTEYGDYDIIHKLELMLKAIDDEYDRRL